MTRLYVAVEYTNPTIFLGYYTINTSSLDASELKVPPRGTPDNNEIPAMFLGRVAVDTKAQGMKIGSLLINDMFKKALKISEIIGCYAVLLDVIRQDSEDKYLERMNWYKDFGFVSFNSDDTKMVMTMPQIRDCQSK